MRALALAALLPAAASAAAQVRVPRAPLIAAGRVPAALRAPARLPASPAFVAPLGAPLAPAAAQARTAALPTTPELLGRLDALAISPAAAADVLAEASSARDAGARLKELGALTAAEAGASELDLAARASAWWDALALRAARRPAREESWPVPAFTVSRDGIRFLVHPVAHGDSKPIALRAVRKLTARARAEGRVLYMEQGMPAHYALGSGVELLDHAAAPGRPIAVATVRPAAAAVRAVDRHAPTFLLLASPFGAAAGVITFGFSPLWLVPVALTALLLWRTFLNASQAGFKAKKLEQAAEARALGDEDLARLLERDAEAFHANGLPALDDIERLRPPLRLTGAGAHTVRSFAMADAAFADAAAKGLREAHILAGYEHAREILWRLENPEETA